jgi:hypothetical protein
MKDINGDFSPEIYVRHAREQNAIRWEYSTPPDSENQTGTTSTSQDAPKSNKNSHQRRLNA